MYLDFEDHRPDVPRVPSAISAREGVLLSLVLHLLLVIFILVAPSRWFEPTEVVPVQPADPPMRYVQLAPSIDRAELARRLGEAEQTRPSPRPEPAPELQKPAPDPPQKVDGAPNVRAAGPQNEQPPQPSPQQQQPQPPAADMGVQPTPESSRVPSLLASGNLGRDLRNPQRYVQNQTADTIRGGNSDQGNADIQFDDKGIDFNPWLRRFRAQVRRNWLIPQVAELARGDVILQFNVLRNGTITDLRVVKAATIDALTISAVNAIKLSNPAPTLPSDYPDDRIQFTVHFYYNEIIRE
jgi:TonB family protein